MTPEENKVVERCMALSAKKLPMKLAKACWIIHSDGQRGLSATPLLLWTEEGNLTRMFGRDFAKELFRDFPTVFAGCRVEPYN